MYLYALVLLVYVTFSKHKDSLSKIELSTPIFENSIILKSLRILIFIKLLAFHVDIVLYKAKILTCVRVH